MEKKGRKRESKRRYCFRHELGSHREKQRKRERETEKDIERDIEREK